MSKNKRNSRMVFPNPKPMESTMSEEVQQPQEELNKLSEALEETMPASDTAEVTEVPQEEVTQPAVTETVATETAVVEQSTEAQPAPAVEEPQPEKEVVQTPTIEDVQENPVQKPEVKIQAVQKPAVVEVKDPAAKSEEEAYFDKIRESGTVEQKRCLAAIESFVQQFAPRTEIQASKATRIQNDFLSHLLWAIEKDFEVFKSCWSVFVVYFAAYHGVNTPQKHSALSEYNTNRYLHAWDKGEDRCFAYRDLITLLRATRNKETRRHDIKTINLDKVGQNVISERGRSNLKQFYGV